VCDRCWREALRYEPDRDASIALDPFAPRWVIEHLARSGDEAVLANLASRGPQLDAGVRRQLERHASPLVQHGLTEDGRRMVPAWSLYRSTPRPGVTVASLVAMTGAVVGVILMEAAPEQVGGAVPPGAVVTTPDPATVPRPATTSPPPPSADVGAVAAAGTVAPATTSTSTSVAAAVVVAPTASTVPAPATTTATVSSLPATAKPPPVPLAPDAAAPAAAAPVDPPVTPPVLPTMASTQTLSFDVPYDGIVSYVAAYGITEVVLHAPDGTTYAGATSAEGPGPAGTWTAIVRTSGAWAGEFASRG
jgi:hypothetical protein